MQTLDQPAYGLSIRARLIMVVLAVAVPMAAVTTGAIWRLDQQARETQRHNLDYAARSLAINMDAYIAKHIAIGQMLASSPALLDDDLTAFKREAERAFPNAADSWAMVTDAKGRQLMNLRAAPGASLPSRSAEGMKTQERAFATGKVQVSNLLIGPIVKDWVTTIDFPIFAGDQPYRVLAIMMTPNGLQRLLDATYIPEGWRAVIIDGNGNVIARTFDPDGASRGMPAPQAWRDRLSQDGVFEGHSSEGDPLVGASAHSRRSEWFAGVAVTKETFAAPVWETIYGAIAISLAVTALSVLVAFWIASRIARPARELERKAAALVRGEATDIQSTVPEITRAWRALRGAVSGREKAAAALRESEGRLSLALAAADIGVQELDFRTGRYVWDQRTRELCGIPEDVEITDEVFVANLHPEDRAMVGKILERARDPAGDGRYSGEFRILNFQDGQERWLTAHGRVTFTDGKPERLIGTIMDITARKRHEEHVEFVMHELSHRSKNLLAVVQSIARQTARQSRSFAAFEDRFTARIAALMAAHDLLVKNDWAGAPIGDVVHSQLAPFEGARLALGGDPLVIRPEAVQNIALALHELATNAAKYGALSTSSGTLEVRWMLIEDPDEPALRLSWIERGGPAPKASSRKGFGSIVLERIVPQALNGKATLDFSTESVSWTLDLPRIWIVVRTDLASSIRAA